MLLLAQSTGRSLEFVDSNAADLLQMVLDKLLLNKGIIKLREENVTNEVSELIAQTAQYD